jgi:hypothetical protein
MALQADRQFSEVLKVFPDLITDSLRLTRIVNRADHKEVRERRDWAKVENPNIRGFFGFGRPDGGGPIAMGPGGGGLAGRLAG